MVALLLSSEPIITSAGKKYNGALLTPTHRLGITDKIFDVKDIVYYR